jgi:small-conductance mechanosensitive channel
MNGEMQLVWTELLEDLSSAAILWQLAVIAASLASAWLISGLLRAYVMQHAQESWKIGIGGFNRVLFPLSSLSFVYIGSFALHHWQHVSLLTLTIKLMWAMAAIRLCVYALRYIFNPVGWVRAMEHIISRTIWVVLALHLTGFWPDLLGFLEDLSFKVGKTQLNLLLIIQSVLTVLLTLFVSLSLSRMLENRLMRADKVDMNVRVVLAKLIRIALSLVAILMGLSAVGFDITLLSVFGGALGVGLGFGLQKIASNYVSGFIILLDDSMHIGDVVTIDGHYGIVSELRFRYMVLRKLDGTEVVIPHETLMTNAVINHSYTSRNSKVNMPVQVSYESDLELAMAIVKGAANAHGRVLEDPPVDVQIKGFGESGIDLNLAFWIPDPEEGSAGLQSEIYLEIWRQFKQKGIVIPYPQREIRLLSERSEKMQDTPQDASSESVAAVAPPNWDDVR